MRRTGAMPQLLRAPGTLESALLRPEQASYYEGADLLHQATLLAIGISQAQAFIDGNKRTAMLAMDVFLMMNGFRLGGDPVTFAQQLERVAEQTGNRLEAEQEFERLLRSQVEELG